MATSLKYDGLAVLLRAAAAKVKGHVEMLGQLDSVVGDGDHGVAMKTAMTALEKGIDDCSEESITALLNSVAMSVMNINAGSTGPLTGSLFMGMAGAVEDREELDATALAALFSAGLKQVQSITTATVGDKTMIDALAPAIEAMEAAPAGSDLADMLQGAAEAAEAGAEKTSDMAAKFGKAKNIGERSIGHKDPGATSMALFFRGLSEGVSAT